MYISDYLQIEWNMIVVTIFLMLMNQTEFYLVHNQQENYHYDNIPFTSKGIRTLIVEAPVCARAGSFVIAVGVADAFRSHEPLKPLSTILL